MPDDIQLGERQTQAVMLPMLYPDARAHMAHGSVGSGKSVAETIAFLRWVDTTEPGAVLLIGAPTMTQIVDSMAPIFDQVTNGACSWIPSKKRMLYSGRTFMLFGAEQAHSFKRIRGFTLAGAMVSEASLCHWAFLDELEGRLRRPGAKLFLDTNSDRPTHPVKKAYVDDPVLCMSLDFRFEDNPNMDPAYAERLKTRLTGTAFQRQVLGLWVESSGAIYPASMLNPALGTHPPLERAFAFHIVMDPANAGVAHAILVARFPSSDWIVKEWRYDHKVWGSKKPSTVAAEVLEELGAELPIHSIIVDPADQGIMSEFRAITDAPVVNAVKEPVALGIQQTQTWLTHGDLRIDRRCAGTISDMGGYVYEEKALERGEEIPLNRDREGADVARYLVMTLGSRMGIEWR